ncbi:flippase [Patescibacteria group bacterium]|nr:flippase [Patescibacteria group bacterium]MBU1907430.1 flippase [Patescibacteria group bacterium]
MASIKKLARNYSIHFSGRVLGTFFGVITIAILTRSLGDTGYGQLTTAMTYLQIFGVMVDFGLTLTLVQMISEHGADERKITGGVLGLRLVSGIFFFGLAAFIGLSLPYSPIIKAAIMVGTLSYLFMTSSGMLVGVFQKHLAIWRIALAELINRFVTLGAVSLFAYLAYGVVAMMVAFVIGNFLQFVFTICLARKYVKIWPRIDIPVWKDAFLRGWPIGLSILFNLLYLKSDIIFLGWFRDQAEVGIYGASYKVLDVITSMPVMYMGLALPALVLAWSKDAKADFLQLMQRSFDFFAIISFPIFIGALVVGVPLMVFISGNEFALSGELLKVLMLAAIAVFFGSLTGHAIVALGLQKPITWGYAITAVVTIIGYILVIPPYGVWGAAWMTVAAEVLITIFTFSVVSYKSKFRPNMTVLLKALAASAVMYGVLMVVPPMNVLWLIVIGAVVYGATLFGIGGVKYATIKDMISRD